MKLILIIFLLSLIATENKPKELSKKKNNLELVDKDYKLKDDSLYKDSSLSNSVGLKEKITLDFLIDRMEVTFPLLSAALQDMMIADSELLTARGAFDASIRSAGTLHDGYYNNQRLDFLMEQPTTVQGTSFFAGYRLGSGGFPVYYGERATNQYGELRAGARVPLFRNREIDQGRAKIKQSEIGMRLADLSIEGQKIEIYRTAMIRYWDWIASVEKYRIAKKLYDIAYERQIQIDKRVEAGDLAKIEQVDNRRILLQREAQLMSAEQSATAFANELSLYLRTDDNQKLTPDINSLPENAFLQMKDLKDVDLNQKIIDAIEKRPDIKRFKAQKDMNRIEKELAKNQMQPGIDFVFMGSQDFGPGDKTLAKRELEASLIVNIPIQTRKEQGKIKGADAKNKKLDEQERFMRDRIEADIKNIFTFLKVTNERARIAQNEVQLASELENSERERFQIGEGTLVLVNIREQTYFEARVREIDALTDHKKALVTYHAVVNDILDKKY
jgi:outer membrane protein, heavy metal efflux system